MNAPTSIRTTAELCSFLAGYDHFAVAIWDFDGVIGDTEPIQAATYRRMLSDRNVIAQDNFFDDLAGRSEPEIWSALQSRYGFQGDITALREERVELVTPLLSAQIAPNWFVRSGLQFLRRAGTPSVIVSSGNQEVIDHYLSTWHLGTFFDEVNATSSTRSDPPKRERLQKRLEGVHALLIEDSAEYIRFGSDLNATTIGVAHVVDEVPDIADAFLKSGSES
jgi:beta-phosphoglucomutase-like phosphatase (HAD superfamily)